MVNNDQQQEKPQDFELMELLFSKVDSSTSDAADSLDKSFEARYQSLVDQIQSYLHSSEKPGFFPHRFLGSFSSVLDTKLNDKLGIKKLHFRFEGARTLKVVAETESKIHVFIFTEDIEAQHSKPSDTHTRSFEFTTGEWKNVMGRDYTPLDERKLQIDVIKILKDKYELVKSKPKSDKDVKSKKLYLYLKRDGVLEYKAKNVYGNVKTIEISRDQLKGKVFDEVKQFLGKQGKDLSDDARKELSRMTSEKGYTLKSDGEDEKINIKVESKKKIKDIPISPLTEFPFIEVKKKLGKSIYLESYIEKLASPDKKQVQDNLKAILNYIKKVHTNLDLQANVYGIKAREADQHGFVAGIFDNFRYRDNTKLYLEQFAGGGYADIVLLVRGPNRAVDSVPILIELKAGTEGQVDPNDALEQAKGYIEGFRPNKMRILTNADNAIAVGLNLDNAEQPFKTEVQPIKQPPAPLMEEFVKLVHRWNNQQISEENFKQEVAGLLSSEYNTFPANKETKDHYYFSRDILGQSILINKIGQDQGNVKKYIYSYNEYPLNWPQGTEYTLSKSPVTTLIFVQGNEGQEKTAFIFHIRESNTREFYADKKIPVLNIPEIGRVGNVIEIKMSLKKYETGLSFEELFEIEQISKYKPSSADQQFAGSFFKIPNSDELKGKLDQAITSQHASDGEVSLQAYKALLTEVADKIYPIKDLITNEARLQAVLNGLLSSYSDLKLKETSTKQQDSAKTVIIPEFQVGAGGRVDMVIQGIGPSPQGTKEYTPIALEFKLIDKNLDKEGMKKEVDKLTKEQNIRYAKGAALKAITDSDKMLFMGVVVNVKAKDKNSLILMSDKFVPALVVHSSIDIAKRKHLEEIQEVTQRLKNIGIQEENLRTLESATAEKDYHYWLQQHDIADIARIKYDYGIDGADTLFEIVGSPEHIVNQLQQFQDSVTTRGERRPLTLIVNLDNNHWVTLVISHQNGQYNGYYVDSLGNSVPDNIRQVLQQAQINVHDVPVTQQRDGYNCGLWALENARGINAVLQGSRSNIPDEIRNRLQVQGRDEAYFIRTRENVSDRLSIDPQRIANLEAVLAETQQNLNISPGKCLPNGGANRKKRNIGMACVDSRDEEKITEKEKLIKELFDTDEIRKRAKSIEFYNELFKVSERISKGKNVDLEGFIKRVKVIDSNSIDSKIRGIVTEIKGKISEEAIDKEGIKDILRRPEVAGEISKVVENIGLTYREFLDNGESEPRNIISRITSNREAMNHLNRIGKISGWAMHGMMYKNLVGDILSGDAEGVAIDLGFIGGNEALSKLANTAAIRGEKLISNGKLFLGKSLKAASPFLARGTTAFIAYDLANQVKEYKGGNKDAMVGIVGDSIVIAVDVAALGIEIAEVAEILTGVSSVTGPIGMAVTAVVFIGTEVYLAVKTVEKEDKIIHLTGWEKFKEGWRAFLHMPPEKYIQELINEKVANNHLVINGVNFLKQHTDIRQYVFPTGRVVGGQHIKVDPNNVVLLDAKKNNIKWSRARPDNPREGGLFCLPQGNWESVPRGGAYVCKNAIGLSYSDHRTGSYTLIDLGEGDDKAIGFRDSPNIFLIGNGKKNFVGGNKDDTFILHGSMNIGSLNGGLGYNTLDLTRFALRSRVDIEVPNRSYMILSSQHGKKTIPTRTIIRGIQTIFGREKAQDKIQCAHDVKYVDGKGGKDSSNPDIITTDHSSGPLKIVVRPNTKIINRSNKGSFSYIASHGKGEAGIDIYHQTEQLKHTFLFNYTLSDLKNIRVQNLPNRNTTVKNVNFAFQVGSTDRFNIDIRNITTNASHVLLKDKTEIKIGNEGNLYALQSTDKPISDIIGNYPYIADRLNMTIAAQSHGEFVIIGHGKHEAMSNEPSCNSHLIGSGGENIYVVAPTKKEVNIYDVHNGTSISTLDLRSVVKDAQDVKISQDGNDLLIKLEEEKSPLKCLVRVKNGTHWYQKLQVVLDSIPMQVECSGNNWSLNLIPLTFDDNTKIIVITARDVKEGNKLIVHKQAGQHTFSRLRDDLIITTDPSLGESNVCTILLSSFYKEPKMQTLSIEFNDTMISLQEKMDEINNSKLVFCSNALQVSERLSINGSELLDNHDCLKFNSDSMVFFRLNNDLLLLSDQGTSLISNYYSQVHEKWNLPVGLNNDIIKPEEFKKRADNPSSFRYYQPDEQGLQIYHNQPINKNDIGLVDLKDKSILDFDMKVINDNLLLSYKNNTLIKVENWNIYQPARKMIFAFNNTIVSNAKCIASTCNSEDVVLSFNKERVILLKEQVFNAIVRDNIDEAKDLIRKIESLNTDGKHELTPLSLAIKKGRLDIVHILFDQQHFTLGDIDIDGCTPLSLAAQEGSLSIAEFFLNEGGYIFDGENPCGTPVRIAARNGNIQMLELLFNKDLNIQIQLSTLSGMIWLIQNIEEEFSNQTDISSNAKIWIKSFIEKLKDSMKGLAKRKLEQDMLDGCSYLSSNLSSEIDKFDKELLNEIITNVIEDMYGRVDMKKMLNCVYSYGSSDQSILGPMAVFDTMKTRGDLNKDAVFRLAYWIKEKMDFYKYPGVSAKEESDLEMLKNQLPKSVRNVVFASQVCIKNVGYQGRYLYAADFEGYPWLRRAENDTQRQPVFLWAPGGNPTERGIQQSLWRVEPAGDNVYIVNVGYQGRYLYAADFEGNPSLRHAKNDAQRQPIFLWAPGGKPTERGIQQSLWRVEPASDNVYIVNVGYQGRYLYAADFEGYPWLRRAENDTQRQPVFLWAPGGNPTERGIQQSLWEVEECGSTAKKNVVSSTVTPHVIPVNNNVGHRGQRHLLSESLDSSNQPGIAASGGTKPSSWINDLCGWAKEKGGKLASGLVNGLYGDTTKELKDSKPADIQIDSSDQLKSKHPSYDQAQEMEFQYMSKYDARKSNDKNIGAYSKKRGNDRQAKQQYGSKMGNEQSVNQSRVVGNEKQQKLGVLHNGPKPTLSHHSNKNHSYFDGQPKKISERKEHIVNYKRCDESAYKHSNQHKPMISANNKWSERISNERIDSRKMIGGANQKQQGFHQNQQSSHDSKHAHLTRATVQIDIPSTILAFSVLTAKVNNQKFNRPLLPKKVQKGKLHAEKVRAEALGRKVGGRIEGTLWFTK